MKLHSTDFLSYRKLKHCENFVRKLPKHKNGIHIHCQFSHISSSYTDFPGNCPFPRNNFQQFVLLLLPYADESNSQLPLHKLPNSLFVTHNLGVVKNRHQSFFSIKRQRNIWLDHPNERTEFG